MDMAHTWVSDASQIKANTAGLGLVILFGFLFVCLVDLYLKKITLITTMLPFSGRFPKTQDYVLCSNDHL